MITASLAHVRDILQAQFCYQLLMTPIPFMLEREYRGFAKLACESMEGQRSEVIHEEFPRHYVLHRFIPPKKTRMKKILIAHGWMSRAAYMIRLIYALHQQGYDVYAVDFPAHGEAKGLQLPWTDSVAILKDIMNQHGPFYGVIGHSYGGTMLLNTLNIAGQLTDWQVNHKPERAILLASQTQMRSPLNHIAKKFKLSGHSYLQLHQMIREQATIDFNLVSLEHFTSQAQTTQFMCIHGDEDETVKPQESIIFCKKYENSRLQLLLGADHVSVLMDKRVEHLVCDFLE